jgi:adenylate cyclase
MAEDEAATVRTLTAYRQQVATLVQEHRGRVVDSPGDNLLAEFPSALEAVSCAVEIQRVITARNAEVPAERRMVFRVAVHLGDVLVEGERIYGDGVNIAARLEALAEPGAVCISRTVHEQVQHKLELAYDDLGEQKLKNIPDPVQAYRVRLEPKADIRTESLPGMEELTVPGFSGRPAIAVLPFDNLSGDPEQEYFADGVAEDLITRLSDWRYFPVIARNSSFTYRGGSVDVKRVSRELGVRYVVEGSVRRAGDRVRISAQVIDATTGHHVWAERYDRDLTDMFALQDEITEAIVASMHPQLGQYETERALRKEPHNLSAWEYAQRGWWHFNRMTKGDNARAKSFIEKAIELDPNFGWAFYCLAFTLYHDIFFAWIDEPARSIADVVRAAEKAVLLDDKDPLPHVVLALAYSLTGEREKTIAAAELAVQLGPSLAFAYEVLGWILAMTGRPKEGIANLEKALRLSPRDPFIFDFLAGMAVAHFVAGRYEEAVDWARRSLQRKPDYLTSSLALAASLAHLGRVDEARRAVQETLQHSPEFTLASASLVLSAGEPDFVERAIDGLRKAGLKE